MLARWKLQKSGLADVRHHRLHSARHPHQNQNQDQDQDQSQNLKSRDNLCSHSHHFTREEVFPRYFYQMLLGTLNSTGPNYYSASLARWLRGLERRPVYQRDRGFSPRPGHYLGCGSDSRWTHVGDSRLMFPSHIVISIYLSRPPSLKSIKIDPWVRKKDYSPRVCCTCILQLGETHHHTPG